MLLEEDFLPELIINQQQLIRTGFMVARGLEIILEMIMKIFFGTRKQKSPFRKAGLGSFILLSGQKSPNKL